MKTIYLISWAISVFILVSCSVIKEESPEETPTIMAVPTLVPTPNSIPAMNIIKTDDTSEFNFYEVDNGTNEFFDLELELDGTRDVYLIFTNPDLTNKNLPQISDPGSKSGSKSITQSFDNFSETIDYARDEAKASGPAVQRGSEEINQWSPEDLLNPTLRSKSLVPSAPLFSDTQGQTGTLYNMYNAPVNATCRLVRDVSSTAFGTKTLSIWVGDDCWDNNSTKATKVTQAMVDYMADKFLLDGPENDIYDWITNIFGEEWADHTSQYANLLGDTDEITIFLYDIAADNSTNGGIGGFYWSKDNFAQTSGTGTITDTSNGRVMFYMDAVMYAKPNVGFDPADWNGTHAWPSEIISTLAHEFQHMINFHKKNVVYGVETAEWLNELMSMCAEDLVADKMEANGPRGVAYDNATAGSANNSNGRLPIFNLYNDYPLLYWEDDMSKTESVTASYSSKYAFGAYLMRNFGGAEFMQALMDNPHGDHQAVTAALSTMGSSDDFSSIISKWAVAGVLSDKTSTDPDYIYNTGAWNLSQIGYDYNLGSINLYNYKNQYITGPLFYTQSPVGDEFNDYHPHTTNFYFKVGTGLSGNITRRIYMESGSKLTVILKN